MIACVAPNPSVDRLFVTGAIVPGTIHRPELVVARPGGKGLNVARAAHALGAEAVAVALLAGHAGRWIADELLEAGMRTDAVWADGETRTSLSVAAIGGMTEFYEHGEPPGPEAWQRFVERTARTAASATWLTISGSLPPGVPASEAGGLVRAGRAAGAHVAVDQHGAPLEAALDAGPQLVKVNRHEAAQATGEDDPARAAAALHTRVTAAGARDATVVVTLGEEGALALTPAGALRGDLDVRGPYPTGSGDAFLAGLVTAAPEPASADWPTALAAALGAACANAELEGAGTLAADRARVLAEHALGRVARA